MESYARKIQKWSSQGKTYTDIANLLSELGVTTTRHSVSRFLNRSDYSDADYAHYLKSDKLASAVEAERERVAGLEPWGLGGPGTFDLPPKKGGYTIVGISDHHGKWRDQALLEAQLRVIRDLEPDLTVLIGDEWNFDVISRWQHKILARMTPLALIREVRGEVDDVKRGILDPVREAAGNGKVIGMDANHTDRLRKYLSDDLHEGWEESKKILGVDDYLDGFYTRAGVFIRDRFLVRHGDTTAQYPAAKELRDSRCSGWSGHLHKIHQHHEPPFHNSNERLVHTIAPCSCRLDYNYGSGNAGLARWHQGMLVGSFSSEDHHDHVTDIGQWVNGKLRLRGELY